MVVHQPVNPAYKMYQLLWGILDWVYPPTCCGCGKPGERWCHVCQNKTLIIRDIVCEFCGRVTSIPGLCQQCRKNNRLGIKVRSWARYDEPLKHAILKLKYKRDVSLGEVLSRHLIDLLLNLNWIIDIIAPVPLSIARFKERGYNQAALLARPLALGTGFHYLPRILSRIRDTKSQVDLMARDRWLNVEGAFKADTQLVCGKKILIVDDVTTSGATLNACSIALITAGANEVYGLTLAQAGKNIIIGGFCDN